MPLKRSSFNKTLFRKNLSRFWPVWGLASVGGALFPLAMLMQLMRYGVDSTFRQGAVELSSMYYEVVRSGLPILSLFYAILIAIAVWSFLYNHRSVTLMHTLPLRREGIFLTNFLSGMAMLLIPYVVTGALTVLISLCFGLFELKALALTVAAVIGESFFYFASATFCAFIVSNVFALPAVYFLLHFLAVIMDFVVSAFAQGFIFGLNGGYSRAVEFLSPTVYFMDSMRVNRTYEEAFRWDGAGGSYYESILVDVTLENAWLVAVYACVGVILLGFGWMLYQRHRSESAGDVVAVVWLRPVFRYGLAVLASLGGGLFLYELFWRTFQSSRYYDVVPMLLFMLLSGLVGYFAAAMLLEKSFRVFRRGWKGCVLVLVGCAAICAVLRFDVFRVAQIVPAIDDVEWVEFSAAGNSYMFYPGEEDHLLEEVRALHQTIVDDKDYIMDRDEKVWNNYGGMDKGDYAREHVYFTYALNNGHEVHRYYRLAVNRDRIYEPGTFDYALDQLVNGTEMRRKRLHAGDDRYTIDSGSVYLEKRNLGFDFNSREAAEVLAALGRDAAEGTWGTYDWFDDTHALDYAMSIDLRFQYRKPDSEHTYSDWLSIRLRPNMTHTIAALRAMGYLEESDMVTRIELYPQDYKEDISYYYDKYGVMPRVATVTVP